MDFQHIVGKKHIKKKRKRSEMDFFGFSDEEHEEEPTWTIPGMDKMSSRGELASTALDIEDVVADEAQNMLTISFKRPMRAFAQKSQSKDGEITFQEVEPSKTELQAAAGDSQKEQQGLLGRELAGLIPRTMKMNLYFEGEWDGENIFGCDSEGKSCLTELKTYLADLQKVCQVVEKKREGLAGFQKRQNEQKDNKFCDLPSSSYAKKAVEEFELDIAEKTGCWESSVLEEEWKAWYELRQKAESDLPAGFEEEEEEEEDFPEDDEDFFESTQSRQKLLKELRKDYQKAVAEAGFSAVKAQAATKGLYIKDVHVVEDGGGLAPRTCTISVRIFSAVGNARVVDLEHEHHARARSCFFEEHAHIKAQVLAFDPETGDFQVLDDLAGTSYNFTLFNMDVHSQTGVCSYSLATAKEAQKLVAAIFGDKAQGFCISDRDAFRVFMMAAGADAFPFTEMEYQDFCPLSYVDMKFTKKIKK